MTFDLRMQRTAARREPPQREAPIAITASSTTARGSHDDVGARRTVAEDCPPANAPTDGVALHRERRLSRHGMTHRLRGIPCDDRSVAMRLGLTGRCANA